LAAHLAIKTSGLLNMFSLSGPSPHLAETTVVFYSVGMIRLSAPQLLMS
jgi:hypothetical protein